MPETELNNVVDCCDLSSDEINFKVKDLIVSKHKTIILKNTNSKNKLLEGLRAPVKIEILGDIGFDFANGVNGVKIVVNGSIGSNSATSIQKTKIVVFGNCSNDFGNDIRGSEVYLFDGCGANSFLQLSSDSKAVIGGQIGSNFASVGSSGTIILLNLSGGNLFVDESWFKNSKQGLVYIRGQKNKIKLTSGGFSLKDTDASDEDLYLPLISEFARLFGKSLSEIKSQPFNKVIFK